MEEQETWKIVERRTHAQRVKRVLGDTTQRHLEQLTKQARSLAGEDVTEQEDVSAEKINARLTSLQHRHSQLREKLSSGSEKLIGARLRQEFEDALAEANAVCDLEGDAWNDGAIATLREQVHREVAMNAQDDPTNVQPNNISRQVVSRILYRVAGKTICGLKGGRIGIQYNASFAGETFETYYCVLSSKSFLEKMFVSEHTIPFFLPVRETERSHLSSSATKFIDCIGDYLQGFVSRREQIRLFKELKGNQIGHFYHSLPYSMVDFLLEEPNCKVTVGLVYKDLTSELPTQSKVLAWPLVSAKSVNKGVSRRGNKAPLPRATSYRLPYAEDALRTNLLPQAYEEIIGDLQGTLGHMLPSLAVVPIPLAE